MGWVIVLSALVIYPVYVACFVLGVLAARQKYSALQLRPLARALTFGGFGVFTVAVAVGGWLMLAPSSATP
jgi:hypothetical protein